MGKVNALDGGQWAASCSGHFNCKEMGGISPGIKQPAYEGDHSSVTNANV